MGVVKCTGQLMGYINPAKGSCDKVNLDVEVMEDLQRCFIYAKRGWKCCRFNFLAVKTINRARGGCRSAFENEKDIDKKKCMKEVDGKKTYWNPRAGKEQEAADTLQARLFVMFRGE